MYGNRRMIYYAVLTVAGIALAVLSAFGILDEFFAGFGGGLAAVGAIRLYLGYKYRNVYIYIHLPQSSFPFCSDPPSVNLSKAEEVGYCGQDCSFQNKFRAEQKGCAWM